MKVYKIHILTIKEELLKNLNNLFCFINEFIFENSTCIESKNKFISFFGQIGVYKNFEKLLSLVKNLYKDLHFNFLLFKEEFDFKKFYENCKMFFKIEKKNIFDDSIEETQKDLYMKIISYTKRFKNSFIILNSSFCLINEFLFENKICVESKFISFFGQIGNNKNFEKLLNLIGLKTVKLKKIKFIKKKVKNAFYNYCIISIFKKY